jgi:polyphosphate kinase 2 (PPK2 family)
MTRENDHKGDRSGKEMPGSAGRDRAERSKLSRKDYEDKLRELHVRLVELQDWVRHEGKKVCAWLRFPLQPSARNRKCTYSDTCRTCRPAVRS